MCRRIILRASVALTVCAAFAALARADTGGGLAAYWPLGMNAGDTTSDGLIVVDDFETWIGEYADAISCDPGPCWEPGYLEHRMAHGGSQAMALDYNDLRVPYFGEKFREFSPVYDWTVHGFDTLVLYVRGRAKNTPRPLYIMVEDGNGKEALVVHPDPQVLLTPAWREWKIPLSSLPGVDMRKVKEIGIGVGDRDNPKPGSAGIVYIDDIRVIRSTP